jgi:hypothetical protein
VRLELAGVLLCQFFGIHLSFWVFFLNLLTIFVQLLGPWLRLLWSDKEHIKRSLVADWVAIKNVTSVLAIVLTQSPSDSFAHHLRRDLHLFGVLLVILADFKFDVEQNKLIIGVSLILGKLCELLFVLKLKLVFLDTLALNTFVAFWLVYDDRRSLFDFFLLLRHFISTLSLFSAFLSFCLSLSYLSSFILSFLSSFLSDSLTSQIQEAFFLVLAVTVLCLLLLVPVLNVRKHLLLVDVRNTVVLGHLSCVERLARARLAVDSYLEGLETTFFAELLLDALDVDSKTGLAMPLEATSVITAFISLSLSVSLAAFSACAIGHKDP